TRMESSCRAAIIAPTCCTTGSGSTARSARRRTSTMMGATSTHSSPPCATFEPEEIRDMLLFQTKASLKHCLVSLAALAAFAACECGAQPAAGAIVLKPLPGKEKEAPKLTKKTTVRFQTTGGDVVIEVYPEAAPNAAKQFVELVKAKFYDDTPVSRVVPG